MKDTDLYKGILARDESIFQIFIDTYINLFYKIAIKIMFSVCSESDVDDCITDSLVYIWFHIQDFNPEKNTFRNWCSLIVLSRAWNFRKHALKQQDKIQKFTSDLLGKKTYADSAEIEYYNKLQKQNLMQHILNLSPPSNEIFIRRYIYHQSIAQIAEKMHLTSKQIDNYLFRAKRKLRKEMNLNDGFF